jgi:hypothetical protein
MADSAAFDALCAVLEEHTSLGRLEARGTVRIALKEAGLDARWVTPDELRVVVQRVLPKALRDRGIDADVCATLETALTLLTEQDRHNRPERVLGRLGSMS